MGTSISSTAIRAYLVGSIAAKISLASSCPEAAGAVRFVSRDRDQRRTSRISRGILFTVFYWDNIDRDFLGELVACQRFSSFLVEETERRPDPAPNNYPLKTCVRWSTLQVQRGSGSRRK